MPSNNNIKNIYKNPNKDNKQRIFWDVDDVILNTSETLIAIINEKYRQSLEPKTPDDQKSWGYRSILRSFTEEQLFNILESKEFWKRVKINACFKDLLDSGLLDNYNNILVTKGTLTNLSLKIGYLKSHGLNCDRDFKYDPIMIEPGESATDKSAIDMRGSIQIDDNIANLINTNAHLKILLKNNHETVFNNAFGHYTDKINPDDLFYEVNTLSEVEEILKFNIEYKL